MRCQKFRDSRRADARPDTPLITSGFRVGCCIKGSHRPLISVVSKVSTLIEPVRPGFDQFNENRLICFIELISHGRLCHNERRTGLFISYTLDLKFYSYIYRTFELSCESGNENTIKITLKSRILEYDIDTLKQLYHLEHLFN